MPFESKWGTYEEVARQILEDLGHEFGLERVESKQKVKGERSGQEWEIDAKGILEGSEGFLIVECRRYTTSRQKAEQIGALAYRIIDTGAKGGIIVSPLGLQEGGKRIAEAENIVSVLLNEDATPEDFVLRFFNKILAHFTDRLTVTDFVTARLTRKCEVCGEPFDVGTFDVDELATAMINNKRCLKCQGRDRMPLSTPLLTD